jgi:hypothetical protein
MKLSLTSNEFFTDLKEKTGFEGSVEDLKEYTKVWLKETYEEGNINMSLESPLSFPCFEIPFLNKFDLQDHNYKYGKEIYIPTLLNEEELYEIIRLWRNGKIKELCKMIDGD